MKKNKEKCQEKGRRYYEKKKESTKNKTWCTYQIIKDEVRSFSDAEVYADNDNYEEDKVAGFR